MTAHDAGLCVTCIHARLVESRRGSTFILCERSRDDARFPRYPALPVLRCIGWQPAPSSDDAAADAAPD